MGSKGEYVSLFSQLGEKLSSFGREVESEKVIERAVTANPWFSAEDILFAVDALRECMLREDILWQWLSGYKIDYGHPLKIGVIMAGNIPLVGFFDMMCVLACGYECHVKSSSKDSVLMEYMVSLVRSIEPGMRIYDYDDSTVYDAVIATGSDNTNRYFRERFSGIPALLRGSRYSAAVLDGSETEGDLRGLSADIFLYNGMGCRSVSLIFIPEGYDLHRLAAVLKPSGVNMKYLNNYRQLKGLMSVGGRDFTDGGNFIMARERDFPSAVSVLHYTFYKDKDEVEKWLTENEEKLQVVVSQEDLFRRHAPFGQAQRPFPWDYPDGRDVIRFLISPE